MAQAVISMKIMPVSPDIDLESIEGKVKETIKNHVGEGEIRTTQTPLAFGLKSLDIIFVMDEQNHKLDPIEEDIKQIEGINSVEVTDVRRAIG